jgi:molybdopterin-guanine dinucleotide biosynthesis protein A
MQAKESRSHVSDTAAVVLAGGKSSRMRQPKALLPFGNMPLIAHIVEKLRGLFAEIVVVAAPGQELPSMAVTLVRDEVAYQGPVAGIVYGLRATQSAFTFATSCDSAFLNTRLVEHLVAQSANHDVIVPHWEGRYQPLHAVYRRTVLPLLEAQLARGELRPVFLFDKVRTRRIDEEEVRRFDPEGLSFFNMNTPEDYEEALRRWNQSRSGEAENGSIPCTVELFGVARLVAKTSELPLLLAPGATFSDVFAALAEKLPMLVGRVIASDRRDLLNGYAVNVNGREFVRGSRATVKPGDSIIILSADAGG